MKLLIAFVPVEQFTAVQDAVKILDLDLMTVSEVLDYQEAGATEIYRGREFRRPAAKVRLEIVGDDESVAAATTSRLPPRPKRSAGPANVSNYS